MTEATSERDPLDMLAEEFLQARRKGAKQSVTEFAAAHPEHADGLKEILPAMLALEQMRRERQSTSSGGPAPHGHMVHQTAMSEVMAAIDEAAAATVARQKPHVIPPAA